MKYYSNAGINIFSILILFILFINLFRPKRDFRPDQKLFFYLIISVAAILVLDSAQWISEGKNFAAFREINIIAGMLYYMLQPVPCICWCLYVRYKYTMNINETMRAKKYLLIPALANAFLAVMSCFYNVLFYVDKSNVYHRGEFFWICAVLISFYFIYALVYIFANKRKVKKEIYYSLLIFAFPPLLGGTVQTFYYGASLVWPCVTLSLLIIYISIQNGQLYTDHLTGLNNRRLLDLYLDRYMRKTGQVSSIGAIMLDINSFKAINDKFGHTTGDQALITVANIMKNSMGKESFLARYGGDEFVVVSDTNDMEDIERIAKAIENNIEIYNSQSKAQYSIKLSMGYSIFQCGIGLSKDDVLNEIDRKMYKKKEELH